MPRPFSFTAARDAALAEMTTHIPEMYARTEAEFLAGYTPWTPTTRKGGDRRQTRHDGWTPERQRLFLCVLRYRRSVKLAAAAVGVSRENAYQLRRRWPPFADHWDRALGAEACTVLDLLLRQLVDGVEVPVVVRGGGVRLKRVQPVDAGLWLMQQLDVLAPDGPRRRGRVVQPAGWDGSGLAAALLGWGRSEW